MSACPWTPEDCAIWKAITQRFRERHASDSLAVQRMRDTFTDGDRLDFDYMWRLTDWRKVYPRTQRCQMAVVQMWLMNNDELFAWAAK
jgi:hypothetical protein